MFPYALMLVSFVYMKIIGALQKNQPQQTSLGDASSLAELSKGTIMQACRNICGQWGFFNHCPCLCRTILTTKFTRQKYVQALLNVRTFSDQFTCTYHDYLNYTFFACTYYNFFQTILLNLSGKHF